MAPYEESHHRRHTLYVVFHGELAFYEDGEYVHILAPETDDHVYLAGSWLGERHIPAGTMLDLKGVVEDTGATRDSIHNHKDHWVLLGGSNPNPNGSHFHLRMPLPEAILPGRLFSLDKGAVTVDGKEGHFTGMDVRPIFKYTVTRQGAYLDDDDGDTDVSPWQAGANHCGDFSLHIFAEEDIETDDDEPEHAFQAAAGLLGVSNVSIEISKTHLRPTDPIPGLHPDETGMTLLDRAATLADLGAQMRSGARALVWTPQQGFSVKSRLFRSGQASCGPVGSDGNLSPSA